MIKNGIEKQIIKLLKKKGITSVESTSISIKEIGLDSIQYIELIVEIEQIYSIEFEEDKLFETAFEYLFDLITYVEAKVCNQI